MVIMDDNDDDDHGVGMKLVGAVEWCMMMMLMWLMMVPSAALLH